MWRWVQAYAPESNKRGWPHFETLTAKRDAEAAKRFLQSRDRIMGNPMPTVINVHKSPAAMAALKADGIIPSVWLYVNASISIT